MTKTCIQKIRCLKLSHTEFWLVVTMLLALVILLWVVLWLPIGKPDVSLLTEEGKKTVTLEQITSYYDRMLAHRNNVLSIIITAFGAWVGAGAAYFFGKENLRLATDGLLQMRDPSPRERLGQTPIKNIPPTPIAPAWNVTIDTEISTVQQQITVNPDRWFIPVVRNDGTLDTVINKDAMWRYLVNLGTSPKGTIADLLKFIVENDALRHFKDIHVTVTMETTVGTANDLMDSRHVFLAIVVLNRKPTHFFTTAEVRKLLLEEGTAA